MSHIEALRVRVPSLSCAWERRLSDESSTQAFGMMISHNTSAACSFVKVGVSVCECVGVCVCAHLLFQDVHQLDASLLQQGMAPASKLLRTHTHIHTPQEEEHSYSCAYAVHGIFHPPP